MKKLSLPANREFSNRKCFAAGLLSASAFFMSLQTTLAEGSQISSSYREHIYKFFEQITDSFKGNAFIITVVAMLLFYAYKNFMGEGEKRLASFKHDGLLSGFFAVMYLGGKAFRYNNSLSSLYVPKFNLLKSVVILLGFYYFYLFIVRLINHILENNREIFKVKTDKLEGLKVIYRQHPFLLVWGIIFLAWSFHIFFRYPGALSADNWNQLQFYFGELPFSKWQPYFHTWLVGSFVNAGMQIFGSANLGLLIYVICQSLAMSGILSYTQLLMYRWKVPVWFRFFAMFLYCVTPYFTGNAAWAIKDYPHIMGFMVWNMALINLLFSGEGFCFTKKSIPYLVAFFAGALMMMLFRNNGLHIYLVMGLILGVIWIVRLARKKDKFSVYPVLVFVIPLIVLALIDHAITTSYNAVEGSKREAFCLPFQQTARYVRDYYDELTDEEIEKISRVLDWRYLPTSYDEECADDIKELYINPTTEEMTDYLVVWLRQFFKHPMCYVEATWNQNYFIFMPDFDNVVYNQDCNAGNAVATVEFRNWTGIHVPKIFQGFPIIICSMYRMLNQIPFIALMNNLAVYVVIMFVLVALMQNRKYNAARIAMGPVWISFLFIFMTPLIKDQPRYSWGIIYMLPTMIALYMYLRNKELN